MQDNASWDRETKGRRPQKRENERSTKNQRLDKFEKGDPNQLVIEPPFSKELIKAHLEGTLKIGIKASPLGDSTSLNIYKGEKLLGMIFLTGITPIRISEIKITDGGGLIIILDANIRLAS